MPFRSLGGSRIIGSGVPQPTPIALDPAPYLGSLVYGQDGRVYASNGTAWVDIGSGTAGAQGVQGIQGVQGLQGDYGPGFTIIGSVADVDAGGDPQATLNTAFPSANIGEGVIDETDDELWIYVGSSVWVNIGSFRGVQGFQGVQGVQGNQGTIGEEGIQGSRGFRGFQGIQGLQGTTGIQGTQGIQGNQGTQGTQGIQGDTGIQGIQGTQGVQGVQGVQGSQGTTGIQGDVGIQGTTGDFGGLSYDFTYDNTTADADPGTGNVRFSSTNLASAGLIMYIDDQDDGGVQVTDGIMTELAGVAGPVKGYMKIVNGANIYDQATFRIDATVTDATPDTYWKVSVTRISGVTSFTNGTDFRISFVRNGEQGVQGIQGTTGIQGNTGIQGIQGHQGIQGPQGVQGVQGNTGVQGFIGFSGGLTFNWDFNASTVEGFPGLNGWLINNSNVTLATRLYIDDLTNTGRRVDGLFDYLDSINSDVKGQIFIRTPKDTSSDDYEFVIYNFSNWTWFDVSKSWGHFDIDWVASSTLGGTDLSPGTNWNTGAVATYGSTAIINFIPAGEKGNQGVQGVQGTTGLQGVQGVQGVQGAQGTTGLQGVQGDTGAQGLQGGSGIQGVQGDTGIQGFQGFQGTQGVQGNQGTTGIQGDTGIQGFIGFQGTQGPQSIQGTTGFQGSQGTQGLLGTTGAQGTQGVQGVQGVQGAQGIAGSYGGASFEYDYTPDITPTAPAGGILKLNAADVTTASIIRLADTDTFGNNIETFLRTIDLSTSTIKAYIKIISVQNPQEYVVYALNSLTENATSFNFFVTYLSKSVNASVAYFTLNTDIIVSFAVTGDQGLQGIQGIQGTQGIQGDIGFQGTTGAGSQGVQGVQGDLGFQGVQGFPGPIGPQGIQGAEGFQGADGFQGATGSFGGVTFDYTWSTNITATDPGVGFLKVNNALIPSATALYMDDRDDNFVDIQPFLRTIDDSTSPVKGHFKITSKIDPAHFAIFSINSLVENAGYFTISCSHVSGSESGTFPNNYDVTITFARTGDVGPAGPQGTQGVQGDLGFQGAAGVGSQGIQGTQGTQGFIGAQGTAGFVGGSGIQGFQGLQGIQGVQGLSGNDGAGGAQGLQGIQGPQGIQGDSGAQGVQGERGLDGLGASGIQGFQGIQGLQGESLQGAQGIQGNSGPAGFGNQGTQGFQGPQGTTGIQGTTGFQGISGDGAQGFQGATGFQGFQGPQGFQGVSGEGNQGVQGFQGPAGIGDEGLQGSIGFQGTQGISGDVGGTGTQGIQGFQGPQGFQGLGGGLGDTGVQGVQGFQGDFGIQGPSGSGQQGTQGMQGFQGGSGVQGFPGQGTQGIQGVQAAQGVQGERGFQGTQGMQGFGNEGSVKNLQNVHTSNLQSTALFITMVEGGATERPLIGTLGPNPGGESNFFYTSDVDELSVENLNLGGNLTVGGTMTSAGATYSSDINLATDVALNLGNSDEIQMSYEGISSALIFDMLTSTVANMTIRSQATSATIFNFNIATGEFLATGDVITNSDERLKENIEVVDNALDKVMNMRGVYFNKKDRPEVRKIGLIAQEVESVIPEAVSTEDEGDRIKSVSYGSLVGLLIEAIKDLNEKVDQIKVQ